MFSATGDVFAGRGQILAIVWEGVTVSGDRAELRAVGGRLIWSGRTDTTQTYLGINLGPTGMAAPEGIVCAVLSAGRVLVYLKEE